MFAAAASVFLSLSSSGLATVRAHCGARQEGLRMRNPRSFLETAAAAAAAAAAAVAIRPPSCGSRTASCRSLALTVMWLQRRSVTGSPSRAAASHRTPIRPADPDPAKALPTKKSRRRITFLTDVEGDREYLERYVRRSKVLMFCDAAPSLERDGSSLFFPYDHAIDFRSDDDVLVFGGDVWDQAGADLYVIRQLLHLRRRHPDRVHFVMGNRDINKMRMVSELGGPGEAQCPPWPRRGASVRKGGGNVAAPRGGNQEEEEEVVSRDPVERLKWILAGTMGSPRAFENRRWELAHERGSTVTDMDVVESYRSSCHPRSGEISEYLANAKLVICLGEALFLHGSLPVTGVLSVHEEVNASESPWSDLTPFMPWLEDGMRATDANVTSVRDWLRTLNEFSQSQVEEWEKHEGDSEEDIHPGSVGRRSPRKSYASLIHYGVGRLPNGDPYPTIVRSGWCDDGMPRRFFPCASGTDQRFVAQTREFFERAGVRLICSGHQPQGDAPNVIRVTLSGMEPAYVLICDTSYSGDVSWLNQQNAPAIRRNPGRESSRSGRGHHAVSEVLIEQCAITGELLEVYFHGVLSDGSEYEAQPLPLAGTQLRKSGSSLDVGTVTPACYTATRASCRRSDVWWTRAALKDGSFLVSRGEGFNVWNQILTDGYR